MKRLISLVICLLMAAQCVMFVSAANFTDVPPAAYFYDAVEWAVANGITAGKTETTFAPNESCTRAQAVSFMYRAAGHPSVDGTNQPFTDVKPADYFATPVQWALENGITAGVTADKFGPHNPCTRGQIVSFLYRAAGSPEIGEVENPFKDVKESDYFYKAVLWAVENGITAGMSADKFAPNNKCTRGQIVCFLQRYYDDSLAIVTQPEDYQMVSSSEDAAFTVEIKGGKANYYYDWTIFKDNDETKVSHGATAATSDTLIFAVTDYDFDSYREIAVQCVVTDIEGNTVATEWAEVLPKELYVAPLTVKTQPNNYYMQSSQEDATFTVAVEGGKADYSYSWNIVYDNGGKTVTNGPTSSAVDTLTLEVTDYDFEYTESIDVYCVITDSKGNSITTQSVQVMPKEYFVPLTVAAQPEDFYMTSSQDTAVFNLKINGCAAPFTYRWVAVYENRSGWEENVDVFVLDEKVSNLAFDVTDYDFDFYDDITVYCEVTDANGNKVTSAVAHVYPKGAAPAKPLTIIAQPIDYRMQSSQEYVSFTVEIDGSSLNYDYEWHILKDNDETKITHSEISATRDTVEFEVSDYDFDDYREIAVYCVITDNEGNTTTTSWANVLQA